MSAARDAVSAIARATARERALARAISGGATEGDGGQLDALLEAARALDSGGVAYAVIGGIAVGIRSGVPRATEDVDIAVASGVERAAVRALLEAEGFSFRGDHEHSANFRSRGGEPVQVAFDAAFDPAITRAEILDVGGVPLRVVGRDDLIEMKERAAADPRRRKSKSLRDRADVEMLRGDVGSPDEGW